MSSTILSTSFIYTVVLWFLERRGDFHQEPQPKGGFTYKNGKWEAVGNKVGGETP